MARLFISHASKDNASAIAVRDWLRDNGWDDVFLDLDPERGISPGERWERALSQAARRCEAVVFLLSRDWLASEWCNRELNFAIKLNKQIFGVLVEDLAIEALPRALTSQWQTLNLAKGVDHAMFRATLPDGSQQHVTFSAEGLKRLKLGLEKAGIDPRFFAWPPESEPSRPPYRGLKPLEAEDAGIFFGREAEIVGALDSLRGLSENPPPRLLVILGASGAGKSSFMRAGLWPRLKRDERNFFPLPVIRPERAALSGESGFIRCLEEALKEAGSPRTRAEIREAVEAGAGALAPLLAELAASATPLATGTEKPKTPTLVIPVDQGEELFLSEGSNEADAFLALLHGMLVASAPPVLALITIRSDAYEMLQTAAVLGSAPQVPFSLPPLAKGAYLDVIEGPARRLAGTPRALKIEPALSKALLDDIEAGGSKDALPLLAFTLERLYDDFNAKGTLTLADYRTIEGIKGSIDAAVNKALTTSNADPDVPRDRDAKLAILRRGLIPWLAGVAPETKTPRRRVAKLSELPKETRPLIGHLVNARLLSTDKDRETGETTIEPTHEALLRQWSLLRGWLEEDASALATLDGVKRAALEWTANGKAAAWLEHHGGRLEDAEKQGTRDEFARYLAEDDRAYLAACRVAENAEVRRERLFNRLIQVAVVVITLIAGIAVWQWKEARSQEARAKESLVKAIETAKSFATETAKVANKKEIAPEIVINLLEPAERSLLKLAEDGEEDPNLDSVIAKTSLDFANSYRLIGKREISLARIESTIARLRSQLRKQPASRLLRQTLAQALRALGETNTDVGDVSAALNSLREAVQIQQSLDHEYLSDIDIKNELAATYAALGDAAKQIDDFDKSLESYSKALEIRKSIITLQPSKLDAELELSKAYIGVGNIYHEHQNFDDALRNYQLARAIRESLYAAEPNNPNYRRFLSFALSIEGEILQENGQWEVATQALTRMMELRSQNVEAVPTNERFREDLAWGHFSVSEGYRLAKRLPLATDEMLKAKDLFEQLLASNRRDPALRRKLGWTLRHVGYLLTSQGKYQEALTALSAARELLQAATTSSPDNLNWKFEYSLTLSDLGYLYYLTGEFDKAGQFYDTGQNAFKEVPEWVDVRSNNREARKDLIKRRELLRSESESKLRSLPSISPNSK